MSATRRIQHFQASFHLYLTITQSRKAYISRRDASFPSFLSVHLSCNASTFISYTSFTRPPTSKQYAISNVPPAHITHHPHCTRLPHHTLHRLRHLHGRLTWRTQKTTKDPLARTLRRRRLRLRLRLWLPRRRHCHLYPPRAWRTQPGQSILRRTEHRRLTSNTKHLVWQRTAASNSSRQWDSKRVQCFQARKIFNFRAN
jgi:hypothetical protein